MCQLPVRRGSEDWHKPSQVTTLSLPSQYLRTKGKKSEKFLLCTTLTLLRKWLILLTNMRGRGNDLKALCNYLVSKNGLCLWLQQFDYKHVAIINNQQEEVLNIDSTHSDIKSSVCCLINLPTQCETILFPGILQLYLVLYIPEVCT